MSMNANQEMIAGYADPDVVILMLILMLLILKTGYADTDADLCIKIMSLCCMTDRGSTSTLIASAPYQNMRPCYIGARGYYHRFKTTNNFQFQFYLLLIYVYHCSSLHEIIITKHFIA